MKTKLLFLAAVLAVFGGAPSSARAWWDHDWALRKKITIDTSTSGAAIGEPIGTVPVLVRLHDGDFRFGDAKEDGSDLRFIAEDEKTPLAYHIEKYDSLLNEAFVWVKIPDLKPGTKTSFWLYYGNSGNKAAHVEDAKATYDVNTTLVYHFAENNAPAHDSTTFGNNAQNAGAPATGALIGPGVRFDGTAAITIPNSESLAWTEGATMTWSAWIKPGAPQPNAILFARRDGAKAFVLGLDGGVPFMEIADANGAQRTKGGPTLAPNAWRNLAVTAEGAKTTLYVDGEPSATLGVALPALASTATLGGEPGTSATGFTGEMDELEIAKVARPLGFLKFVALDESGDGGGKLLSFGQDEQTANWFGGGFLGIILRSLTIDGWIVIGILVVMSAISWFVMVGKARYLNATAKGNAQFFKDWNHVAADLSFLDDRDARRVLTLGGRIDARERQIVRHASIYRIYKIGAEEIRHRLSMEGAAESHVLSARSIQAIRASLDGGLVRELQKLNRQLVLLTIAISGGPFLGLLGTVVGVMITFAAIAAAGDVNVNAFAPGIAAALAATVAGLVVAIPALFGYNYLLSLVKDATSDMQVFIDEFVTKMAEYYGGRPAHLGQKTPELEMIA